MRKIIPLVMLFSAFCMISPAQKESPKTEIKTGNNIGVLPAISYNSDLGFQYGLLANFFNYGDGSSYPKYRHSLYGEISRFTKGSGIYRLYYDSEFLVPKIRLTAEAVYFSQQALNFHGFNGYNSLYHKAYEDDQSSEYISRMYYKHERNTFRIKLDFQGHIVGNYKWVAGYTYLDTRIGSVPIDKLNKGKDSEDLLPDTSLMYDNYVDWGIIKQDEANGGKSHNLKLGVVYDTRDNEACPMSGMWSEIVMLNSFGKVGSFGKLSIMHRQYYTLIPQDLSLAYRLGYQGKIWGDEPFYMYPYMVYSYQPSLSFDGLGGARTVRGMVLNRLVAESVAFANIELRWKFSHFRFLNQQWYAALSPFMDFGRSLKEIDIDTSNVPDDMRSTHFSVHEESIHATYGVGLHFAMNQNFVIAADAGIPLNEEDGGLGVYIGMNWIF